MQKKKQRKPIRQIIILTILAILLLLLIFAEDIIKLINGNKTALLENTANKTTIVEPNIPVLSAGMIPVKWNGTNFVITTQEDKDWYDYKNGKPAYIMLNDGYYQSELKRGITDDQVMENAVGNDALVVPNVPNNNPTILMWIPRFAINNETNEIQYIKNIESTDESSTIPDIFTYKQALETAPDFALTGIWIQKTPLSNGNEVTKIVTEMNNENGRYGFIKNTIAITAFDDPLYNGTLIEKFITNLTGDNNLIDDVLVIRRSILKIIDIKSRMPIKAKCIVNNDNIEITINVTYSTNKIAKIEDSNGNILSQNENIAIDTEIPRNGIYYYIITDELGNTLKVNAQLNATRTLTYNANGGTTNISSTTVGYGTSITMPTPQKNYIIKYETGEAGHVADKIVGYTFDGWYTQATDGEKREYTSMPKNSEVLYAHWTPTSIQLPTPTIYGYYTFQGWYKEQNYVTKIGDPGTEYTPTANVTLYAKWQANPVILAKAEGIKIGDYVNYDATATTSSVKYTASTSYTGYTYNQDFEATNQSKKWKILSVNESTGVIELYGLAGPGQLRLKGKTGYSYAISVLNSISAIYGRGKGAQSARSIKIADLNKISGKTDYGYKYNFNGLLSTWIWLADRTVKNGDMYYVGCADYAHGMTGYHWVTYECIQSGNTQYLENYSVGVVVTLKANIKTNGKNSEGVWQLDV